MGAVSTKIRDLTNSKTENYNEYLEKNFPEYSVNHFKSLKTLIENQNNLCKNLNTTSNIGSLLSNTLDYNSQANISCIVKDELKKLNTSSDGLKVGNTQLQRVFTPIRKLSSGLFGMAMSTGFKGSKPFAIMKVSLGNEKMFNSNYILHEIVIGLLLNTLRKDTPCFSYCYGGFYCAVPVDIKKTWTTSEDDYDEIENILIWSWRNQINTGSDLSKDPEKTILSQIRKTIENFVYDDLSYETFTDKIKIKIKDFTDTIQNEEVKSKIIDKFDTIISYKKQQIIDLKEKAKYLKPKLDISRLCNNDNKDEITSICLFEFVDKSVSLSEFIPNASDDEIINIMIMIYASLYIAYKKHKFIHNDLHGENILVRRLDQLATITINIDSNRSIDIRSRYLPQFIDYGLSYAMFEGVKIATLQGSDAQNNFNKTIQDSDFFNDINILTEKLEIFNNIVLPEKLNNLPQNLEGFINTIISLHK